MRLFPFMLAWLAVFATPVLAAEAQAPIFWDTKERLPKPDLTALPRLRILTTTDFPPFNYLDGNGRLSGLHIDLARSICVELDIADRCEIQALPRAELGAALAKGDGEAIIAGIGVTEQSREDYAFSRSYLQFPARFMMPKTSAASEPVYSKIRGKRIGVIGGSAHERMAQDYFPDIQLVPYPSQEDLYAALK